MDELQSRLLIANIQFYFFFFELIICGPSLVYLSIEYGDCIEHNLLMKPSPMTTITALGFFLSIILLSPLFCVKGYHEFIAKLFIQVNQTQRVYAEGQQRSELRNPGAFYCFWAIIIILVISWFINIVLYFASANEAYQIIFLIFDLIKTIHDFFKH